MLNNGEAQPTRLLNVPLPGGLHLLIGRDVEDRAQIRALILNGLAWAVVAALISRLRVLSSRVAHCRSGSNSSGGRPQRSCRVIGAKRIPEAASGDEFDQLTRTINQMLEQIQALLEGVRNVSNAVAHDLRTPLAEARTRLEDVLRRYPSTEMAAGVEQAVEISIASLPCPTHCSAWPRSTRGFVDRVSRRWNSMRSRAKFSNFTSPSRRRKALL